MTGLNDRNKSGLTGQVGLTDVCVKQSNQEFNTNSHHETARGCNRPLHWRQISEALSLATHGRRVIFAGFPCLDVYLQARKCAISFSDMDPRWLIKGLLSWHVEGCLS